MSWVRKRPVARLPHRPWPKSRERRSYVVAGKKFPKESEAKLALVAATEKYVTAFAEPNKCPKSGTITVGGQKACCPNTAAATSEVLKAAMAKVKMSYVVGDQECGCPNKAKQLAKDSGKAAEFVVAGQKTCCNVTARLNLARAKYVAAVQALAQADAAVTAADGS